jgi:hypothetical protein
MGTGNSSCGCQGRIVLLFCDYDQLEFSRLDDRQVSRLLAFEESSRVDTDLSICIARSVTRAHQATSLGEVAGRIDRRAFSLVTIFVDVDVGGVIILIGARSIP